MSDWQVGDLAVCVDNAPRSTTAPGIQYRLECGRVYRVSALRQARSGKLNLFMEGVAYPFGIGNGAFRFRKIRPDQHEACEPEFVTLLKRTKRTVPA
jgi:hypothetical protein